MINTNVIIIGGGVAGLATANVLAHKGIKSIVIEESKQVGDIDRGDVIHQSMIDLFKKWGVIDVFESYHPLQFHNFQVLNYKGKRFFHVDLAKEFNVQTNFTVLKHPNIERFLEQAALRTKKVVVNRGEVCQDLLLEHGRIVGAITNKNIYKSNLTVIANGSNSIIRDKYFGKPNRYEYSSSFYNGCFELIPKFSNSGCYVLGNKGALIMIPLPDGQMRIGVQFKKGEKVSSNNIIEVITERLDIVTKDDLKFIDGRVYRIFKSMGKKWHIPGAVLLGDAVHTVHPVGGQGMNSAFRDADALSEILVGKDISNPAVLDEICWQYEKKRKKEVQAVLKRTHIMGILGTITNPVYIKVREKLISTISHIGYFKRKIFDRIINVR